MKAIGVGSSALCVLALLASPALAHRHKYKQHRHYEATKPYPHATERQRQNSLAFDNGGYYETIHTEHAFGSRSWWMLQQRGGGRR